MIGHCDITLLLTWFGKDLKNHNFFALIITFNTGTLQSLII